MIAFKSSEGPTFLNSKADGSVFKAVLSLFFVIVLSFATASCVSSVIWVVSTFLTVASADCVLSVLIVLFVLSIADTAPVTIIANRMTVKNVIIFTFFDVMIDHEF